MKLKHVSLMFITSLFYLVFINPPLTAQDNHYRFMIIGDRTGGNIPGVFEGILQEVELLQPDFCMTVGDHIEGYTRDTDLLNRQWKEYFDIEKVLSMPVYHTPGNHDIQDATSESIFREYVGKPYFSFNHQGTHFVILNSSTAGSQPIPDDQISWLAQDLKENSNAQLTFVFFHHPEWWHEELMGKREKRLISVLEENGVDAVFTGHWHRYLKGSQPGINFYTIGSSGGVMGAENIDAGEFFHYAHVAIDGSRFKVALLKRGSVLPDTVFTIDRQILREKMQTSWAQMEPLTLEEGHAGGSFTLSINNPYDKPLKGQVRWNLKDSGWKVEPGQADYEVPPGASQELEFQADGSNGSYVNLPSVETDLALPGNEPPMHLSKPLLLAPRFVIPRLKTRVPVGKEMIAWPSGKVLVELNNRNMGGTLPSGDAAKDLSASLSMGWSDRGLYLGLVVADNIHHQPHANENIWAGDSVQIGIDTQGDGSASGYGADDYEYTASLTQKGPAVWRHKGTEKVPSGPAPDILFHVVRDDSAAETRYQILLPWESLAPASARTRNLGIDIAVNDDDGKGRGHWLELTPGIVLSKSPENFAKITLAGR